MTVEQNFCVGCGEKLLAGVRFCTKCGQAIPGLDQTVADLTPSTSTTTPVPIAPPPSTPPTPRGPDSAAGPMLPPVALPSSVSPPIPGASLPAQPVANKSTSRFLWLVGGSLLVVLLLAGYRLLPKRAKVIPAQAALKQNAPVEPSSAGNLPSAATPSSQRAASTQLVTPPEPPRPIEPAAVKPDSNTSAQLLDTEGVPGIVSIPLDEPESYLPYFNTSYQHFIHYPDGDSGKREMVVAAAGNPGVITIIELIHSDRHPNDPPSLWVYHYSARDDGLYRVPDEDPSQAELYLPRDLAVGKRWKDEVGSYEVTDFDTTITVEGQEFRGVLAYRLRNPEVDLDQTTWLAPGYGEVLVRHGAAGSEICRLLGSEPKDPRAMETLLKRHVGNLEKVR